MTTLQKGNPPRLTLPFPLAFRVGNVDAFQTASETIAQSYGAPHTVIDILHGNAFRYYSEGLRQYVAVRCGTVEVAETLLPKLRDWAAEQPPATLVSDPGPRARLYREARRLVLNHRPSLSWSIFDEELPKSDGSQTEGLPWRAASPRRSVSPLYALRNDCVEAEAELLELTFARGLTLEEVAFVLDCSRDEARARLTDAYDQAQRTVAPYRIEGQKLEALIVEAYALQPKAIASGGLETIEGLPVRTVVGGRYEIVSRVGTGAFGDVYRAKDTEVPGHVVALKLLHSASRSASAQQSALRELRLIASVFHPSIVQFKDHGWHDQRLWFVMPWYDGETLEARIKREKLGREEAMRIFEPLARALAAMHAAGVRHQDIKPDNVFLARIPGEQRDQILPVLLDLGVATNEAEIVVAGTPTYFSPEVASQFATRSGIEPITEKSDVFSLALSLRNALEPETQDEVRGGAVEVFINQRATTVPTEPSSRDLRYLRPSLDRWMNLDPTARPSAEQFAAELEVLVRPEKRRARRRAFLQWALPMLLTVVAGAGAAIAVFHARAETERLEAIRARAAAAGLQVDLNATKQDQEALQQQLERTQLTRAELTARLAEAQSQLERTRDTIAKTERSLTDVHRQLDGSRQAVSSLEQARADAEGRVNAERDRSRTLTQRLASEEIHAADLQGQIAGLMARLSTEAERSESLRRQLGRTINERESMHARASELEDQLAAERAARAVLQERYQMRANQTVPQ